jgi:hypothetical protein
VRVRGERARLMSIAIPSFISLPACTTRMPAPPTRWGVSDAAGAHAAITRLASSTAGGARAPKAVLFTATPDPATGVPWCPDCARTLAGVRKALAHGSLLEVEVTRAEWKNPAAPSPLRAAYGLSGIPALALLSEGGDGAVARLLGPELEGAGSPGEAEALVGRWLAEG